LPDGVLVVFLGRFDGRQIEAGEAGHLFDPHKLMGSFVHVAIKKWSSDRGPSGLTDPDRQKKF
jgi:hypothetical protein